MAAIKAVLREELGSAEIMKAEYVKALKGLLKGALVRKVIKGRDYWYLAYRKDKKIIFQYLGRLPEEKIKEYGEARKLRAKYRNLLSHLKERIKYLKGVLRGKREI